MIKDDFKTIEELEEILNSDTLCNDYLILQRWGGNVCSPYNPNGKIYRRKDGTFRCATTGYNFSVFTGTPFNQRRQTKSQIIKAVFIMETCDEKIWVDMVSNYCKMSKTAATNLINKVKECAKSSECAWLYSENKKKTNKFKNFINKLKFWK